MRQQQFLEVLDRDAYVELERIATRLADGMQAVFDEAGLTATVPRVGPLVGFTLRSEESADAEDDGSDDAGEQLHDAEGTRRSAPTSRAGSDHRRR